MQSKWLRWLQLAVIALLLVAESTARVLVSSSVPRTIYKESAWIHATFPMPLQDTFLCFCNTYQEKILPKQYACLRAYRNMHASSLHLL